MRKDKLQAVIFDFDGTIADTEAFYADNFSDTMKENGIVIDEEDRIVTLGFGPYDKVEMMEKKYHVKLDAEAITLSFRKKNAERFPEDASSLLFDDVKEALEYCRSRKLKLYICSNTDSEKVEKIVKQMGIFGYFDGIIGKDISGARKPSSIPYLYIAEHYHYDAEEILAIEDSKSGVQSATGAGVRTAGLYRVKEADLGETDFPITSLKELKEIIE